MTRKIPLHDVHQKAGAVFTDFYGWEVPLHFNSAKSEHQYVKQSAGVFDLSHLTVIDLLGAGGRQFLRYLLANDVDTLAHIGQAMYSCMLDHHGVVIADLIIYQRASDNYRLVFNAAKHEELLEWIQEQADTVSVGIQERIDLAMLAVQGPNAMDKLFTVMDDEKIAKANPLKPFEAAEVDSYYISRMDYTGEDGFAILLPIADAKHLWGELLANGVIPCGLSAFESLRSESGMLLIHPDTNETVMPLGPAFEWSVAWQPEDRDFIGRAALELQKEQKNKG